MCVSVSKILVKFLMIYLELINPSRTTLFVEQPSYAGSVKKTSELFQGGTVSILLMGLNCLVFVQNLRKNWFQNVNHNIMPNIKIKKS